MLIMWLACAVLLVARALIAAAESALFGVSDERARELAAKPSAAGRRVLHQRTEREKAAASLKLALVGAGFLAAALAAVAAPHVLVLGASSGARLIASLVGVLVVVGVGTALEATLRSISGATPESWALSLSPLVSLLIFVLTPFARGFSGVLSLIAHPLGTKIRFEPPPPPLEELERMLAAQAASNEEVDQGAPELIRSIFEMSDKRCRDVMVPRTEVVMVNLTTPPSQVLRLLAEENHSRIPVYRDDPDHIVGVLHARDLIPLLQHPELIVLSDIVRPPHYVPWMKSIGDLLREMQKERIHMAMVVDEYGGFMGVVTLEDILREIVGDIGDEFEEDERQLEKQADGSFLVDAGLDPEEFSEAFGFPLPEGDFETLGGFLSSLHGSIPEVGDRFVVDGWQFTVAEKEGPRLERVRMAKLKSPPKDVRPAG